MRRRIFFLFAFLLLGAILPFKYVEAQEYKIEFNLQGNKGEVQNIRFNPDGKYLAGGDQFGNILIWNVKTGKLEKSINGHTRRVLEVTFNKSGSMLASTSEDGSVAVWDTKSWRLLATFKNKPFVNYDGRELVSSSFVVFSPDSRFVYFGGDNGYIMKGQIQPDASGNIRPADAVFSTNYEDGRWYGTITGGCISGDEKYLVITVGHLVDFIDLKTDVLAKYFRYDEGYLNDVVVGPQLNTVATWSDDGKVNIWNSATGQITNSFQVTVPGNYSGASFSKDGKYLVSSASGTVAKLWDVASGRQISTLTGHTRIVRISRFSPTENVIATASYDGTVNLWREKKEEETPPVAVITTPPVKEEPKKEEPPVAVVTPPVKEEPKKDVLKDIKIEEVHEGDVIQLENILFKQSRPELLASSYDELKKLLEFMKKYPKVEIELSGHTDNVGDPAKNQKLSEQRVIVVKNYLIKEGIKENRIKTVAYGGDRPIADNRTEAGRQKNRRVEMKILKK